MPEVKYGGQNGETIQLEVDPELVAVRARRGDSLREGPVPGTEAGLLNEMEPVLSYPEVGVEVYRRRERSERSMEELRKELDESPATRFAGRVLVDEKSREPVLYTENLFVKFSDGKDRDQCAAVLREAGLTVKRELPYAANAYFVAAPEGTGQKVFEIADELLRRDDVEYCHPELVRPLGRRAISSQQWHLKATTVDNQWVNESANVEAAHTITEGEGVTIAVIDTGIDIDHEEFSGPGKVVAPRDTTANDANPRPSRRAEKHGTACAGVACASGRFGASGVAPRAKLMPIRMISQLGSQAEAEAFYWAAENGADVVSCSWGPADGYWKDGKDPIHDMQVPLPDSTRLAIDYAVTNGRGGLGCVVFFAAGNGNESVDNDGYASYDRVLAVAACNDQGQRSVYSDYGEAVFCAFPSNDLPWPEKDQPAPLTPGIWTTDRTGRAGYSDDDYTNSFGGTSSACPGAAGVAALVLSSNESLRWDAVRDLMRRSCDRIDPERGKYDEKGHSHLYGHGRLNAEKAARSAGGGQARRIHGRRIHGRRIHGRSTAIDDELDLMDVAYEGTSEDARKVLDLAWYGGLREQVNSDLLLGTLLASQAGQIQDLRERVAHLEQADQ
jgi:subtilisin family serine protease